MFDVNDGDLLPNTIPAFV